MSVLTAIGKTPLVELKRLAQDVKPRLFAKLEAANPGGSIKDRPALYMIRQAEESGELTRDKIIVEPTSGNTGIAIAMIGAAKGYRVKLFMPACVSEERQRVLEAHGAEVVLTEGCHSTDGAIRAAHELVQSDPDRYYMPNQFENPANAQAHYETTGPEIYEQTGGRLDAFVAGMGTTGTLMGVSRFLKERNPRIRIVGVEPTVGHKIQGLKNMDDAIVPKIYDPRRLDGKITVEDDEAFETARRLAKEEGLFVGMSSGAAVAGARRLAREMDGGVIVTVLPDRGDRYLSTTLFRPICAECPP